ncbi:MAG: RluA family pseudouridine synthase [Balneolaceae bacterium]|nr:RluA family pseudouridine synthase [Balneolaceae bacterium]
MNSTGTKPDIPIFHEDEHLLVVNKPAGLLSQADHTGDPDLLSLCKRYLRAGGARDPFLGLVHRLDRPVAGVMMLAKTRRAAEDLARQVRDRLVQKTYRVTVFGKTAVNGVLTHHLEKDRSRNVVTARDETGTDSKEAVLSFARLDMAEEGGQTLCLLSVHLQTGRPHQIRVQLAAVGHAVWGDYKYGPEQPDGRAMALRAYELVLRHPATGKEMRFTSQLPQEDPWNRFNTSSEE